MIANSIVFIILTTLLSLNQSFGFKFNLNKPINSKQMFRTNERNIKSKHFGNIPTIIDSNNILNNVHQIESTTHTPIITSFKPISTIPIITMLLPLQAQATDISTIIIARPIIDIFVNVMCVLFLFRTIISWYPKTDLNKFPYNIIAWPTEALAQPVRAIIPPAFGVDISSIVWIMFLSFTREILTGQQGLLTLLEKSASL